MTPNYEFNKLPRSFVHGNTVVTFGADGSRTECGIAEMIGRVESDNENADEDEDEWDEPVDTFEVIPDNQDMTDDSERDDRDDETLSNKEWDRIEDAG